LACLGQGDESQIMRNLSIGMLEQDVLSFCNLWPFELQWATIHYNLKLVPFLTFLLVRSLGLILGGNQSHWRRSLLLLL